MRFGEMPHALNQGVKIHFEVRGEGLPLVLQTGGLGDMGLWEGAGYLEGLRGYKCILIDPRGHGSSDHIEDLEAHRMRCYVSDVITVLDQLGVYRASFFGYSNGGRVGFALCAAHPGRVTALIAMGSCVDFDRESSLQYASILRDRGLEGIIEVEQAADRARIPLWFRENLLKDDPEMLALDAEAWADWEGAKRIASRISAPTLLITGSSEDPGSDCVKIASLIPSGAELMQLPDLGHLQIFLQSHRVIPRVRDFLSRVQFGLDRRLS
jgi:pimeloyl-ACP methyl ester carboxylesterase